MKLKVVFTGNPIRSLESKYFLITITERGMDMPTTVMAFSRILRIESLSLHSKGTWVDYSTLNLP